MFWIITVVEGDLLCYWKQIWNQVEVICDIVIDAKNQDFFPP